MKNNYVCLFLFLFFAFLFSLPFVFADSSNSSKTIIIDVGHGGVDPGTVVGTVYEKDINLKISLALKEELEKKNVKVYLTRDGDYDLATPKAYYRKKSDFDHRISFINQSGANLYVSIHLNYLNDSSYSGAQVFYSNVLKENKEMAQKIQEYLNSQLKTSREIKKISDSIYMYSKLTIPGVLIECGFLSNANERKKLQDKEYIQEFSKYLAEVLQSL